MTPLHRAVEIGNAEMVKMLFIEADDKNPAMTNGITPLHLAAQYGDIDTIRLICPEVSLFILSLNILHALKFTNFHLVPLKFYKHKIYLLSPPLAQNLVLENLI